MTRAFWIVLVAGLLMGGVDIAVAQDGPITGLRPLASMPVQDCDGIALGDINGDGAVDLLSSSGAEGKVFWFEQGQSPTDWRRHPIYEDAIEIEGNDLADVDGDGQLEAFSLDQEEGTVLLHRPADMPRGVWKTAAIQSGRPYVQASLATDLDGDGQLELVYTWEGTEPGAGGVNWLDYEGGPVQAATSWADHTMVTHESAWWLVPRRMDVNEDGAAREIVYTGRSIKNRNAGARPGLFWLAPGEDPTAPWQRHAIDTSLTHPLHVDRGQFSVGSSEQRDLVVGGFDTPKLHYYTWTSSWQRHALDLPTVSDWMFNEIWNVKALPGSGQARDAILAVLSQKKGSAMVVFQHQEGQYESRVLKELPYTHPMDDRLLLHDLTGDDDPELIVPDSGGGRLVIFQIERSNG